MVVEVLLTLCLVVQGLLIALWINGIYEGRNSIGLLAAFGSAAILRSILSWVSEVRAQATAQATKTDLRERLLAKVAQLGPGYIASRQTGDLQTIIVNGVESIEVYFSRYVPAMAAAIVGCAGILAIIAAVDWRSAAVLLFFLLAHPTIDRIWMRWRMPKLSGVFAASAGFGAYLLDNLQGLLTLKAFDVAGRRRMELARRARVLRQEAMPKISFTMARIAMSSIFTMGGVAVVLALNSWRVAHGTLSPFALFLILFLAREVFRPIERLEKEFHPAQAAKGAAKPILELLTAHPSIREPSVPAIPSADTSISFEHVRYSYSADAHPALDDVSFTIPQGKIVALVGPSGAGKSTLFSLMLRFLAPQSGVIRIGGVDIADLASSDLRAMLTLVPQDIQLLHGTIADNLRLARPDASDEDLRAAARVAKIDEFIDSLPQGYESATGERGSKLSGGQRQRIAIARALLKDAPILLLDEATSSIDPANEFAIWGGLKTLMRGRTTLVIAHRISTIEWADHIIVMNGGRIVEQGTHVQLLAARGLYHRLFTAQTVAA